MKQFAFYIPQTNNSVVLPLSYNMHNPQKIEKNEVIFLHTND